MAEYYQKLSFVTHRVIYMIKRQIRLDKLCIIGESSINKLSRPARLIFIPLLHTCASLTASSLLSRI